MPIFFCLIVDSITPVQVRGNPREMALSISSWFRFAFNFIHFKQDFSLPGIFLSMVICWLTLRPRWRWTGRSQMMSPDTVSSLFPDRPIRPLPKRRLRERLPPEAADSIKCPVSTRENAPFFHYPPYTVKEAKEGSSQLTSVLPDLTQSGRLDDSNRAVTPQRYGVQSAAGEEVHTGARSTVAARTPPEILNLSGRQAARQEQPRQVEPQPPPSATPSLDGYDSFENTNNKKKRKIPSAGESSINGTHGHGNEMNGLGLSAATSPPVDDDHGTERSHAGSNTYQDSTSYAAGNQGFSGPGRGRLGRSGNARTPLRTLPDGNTTWTSRGVKAGTTHWPAGKFIIVLQPSVDMLPGVSFGKASGWPRLPQLPRAERA